MLNQPTKITSVACFFSMQIFNTWENCRVADLKNSLYFLIISTKNKTVSTPNHITLLARLKEISKVISVGVDGKKFSKKRRHDVVVLSFGLAHSNLKY